MPTLHLGVIDLPYNEAPAKGKRAKKSAATTTTGDVAEILEENYGVMAKFYELHQDDIAKALENSAAGALETLMMGGNVETNIAAGAESKIENMFKKAISGKEFDGLIPGVPTEAAKRGVNHRLAHPYAKRGPRPSFLDTSLYSSSFKSWVED